MSNLTKALLILAAFAIGAVMWWKITYPTYAWNQKLTVTVSTPQGEVSGSSVVAVSWAKNFFSGGWGGALFHLTMRGDATTVDLGGGQFLFAVLGYHGSKQCTGLIALKLLGDEKLYWSTDSFKRAQAARGRGPITLPQQLYPVFLRFRDIKDWATVERVDPDDLAKSFGSGVRLVRVTIEITDDPVTRGIRNVLPWLSGKRVGYLPVPMAPDLPLDDFNFIDVDTL
jgi:hypothetical protein